MVESNTPSRNVSAPQRPRTPRWVKVVGLILTLVAALLVAGLLAGGEHGPGRHSAGQAVPAATGVGLGTAWR